MKCAQRVGFQFGVSQDRAKIQVRVSKGQVQGSRKPGARWEVGAGGQRAEGKGRGWHQAQTV